MYNAKYIMWGSEFVIFPPSMQHSTVASKLGVAERVSSAGIVIVEEDGVARCSGSSLSMHITPTKEEHELASRLINTILSGGL